MKRIDKIHNYILEHSKNFTKAEILNNNGPTAQEIGNALDILRNNVSKELNNLCRDKKLIKIKNRPVLYFDKKYIEDIFSIKISSDSEEISIDTLLNSSITSDKDSCSPFSYLIGYNTSLKNQIEQAKAALMYPPNGLHTLIIGSTGVGKSLFANIMYQYAKYIKKLSSDAPFIVFNCADYANNPQLLLSHIFGHIKSAFTGADKETDGIVAKADGGILFLDEIHRLPPEGQEMIFYFMDTGTYNKLGETERNRKANVLLISATTEDPNSALLNTFIRRIPITIAIPNFNERPLEDKVKLIQFLISKEAQRVNKAIKISDDAIKALIGSTSYGNVGQLKSNIQLICAKGFLNSINTDNNIEIDISLLPGNIKNGLISFGNKDKEDNSHWNMIPKYITINPDDNGLFIEEDSYEPSFNIYNIIQDKTSALKEQGMKEEDIKNFITTDINLHLKQFYDRFKNEANSREGLLKIVDKDIVDFTEDLKKLVEKKLDTVLNDRFIYAISLHFSALFNRIKTKLFSFSDDINLSISTTSKEFEVAKEIYSLTEEKFNIVIPPIEIEYLALLLSSINDPIDQKRIGIVVAAHGISTATSMVNVAKKLFEADNIVSVDMPLEKKPLDILEDVILKVKEINEGKGVLLLVDMGSLNTFADVITERTGISTKSIDMVSTPLVLEAVRKCSLCDSDLNSVYSYLIKDFRGYTNKLVVNKNSNNLHNAIVTVCSTGKGAAIKLKELVQDIVTSITPDPIEIIPVSTNKISDSINHISKNRNILSVVGITNPKLGLPFISIESLIDGSGEEILRNIIEGNPIDSTPAKLQNPIVIRKLCKESLQELLTFLNPEKIYPLLEDFMNSLGNTLNLTYENPVKLKFIIHLACALERMVVNDGLEFRDDTSMLNKNIFNALKQASAVFNKSLSIILTDDELYYMVDILEQYTK